MAVQNVASPAAASAGGLGASAQAAARRPSIAALAVLALTLIGAVVRVIVAHQSVFADELSTYWISATHGLGGVLSLMYSTGRIHHAEITPPLSFLASWLTTRAGHSPELLRLPALIAGTATIPLVYLLGLRTVGRRAALLASALTALSPFMIYYSAEARAYGLLMFLVVGSTLSMLLALDTGRRRWWVLYALCSAAAFLTHYTCLFVLGVQLVWLLWTQPATRRPALLANAGAALLVVPWIPGLIEDLRSPTVKILSALSAFTPNAIRIDVQHWSIGYPYTVAGGLRDLPGTPALVLLAVAAVLAIGGALWRAHGRWRPPRASSRIMLVAALMLATPVAEIVASAVGNHIIGVRDLAASWPYLALSASAVVAAAGPTLGLTAAVLAVIAFALGAAKMLEPRFSRPNFQGPADHVTADARPGDVVIDGTGSLSPGPLTGFQIVFHRRLAVVRALAPAEDDHPFNFTTPIVPIPTAFSRAVRAARGNRIFVVSVGLAATPTGPTLTPPALPGGYVLCSQRRYEGFVLTLVSAYSRSCATA
jgi:Dolichyl-phosphate-mannose-protein mannosyltransferase